MSREISALEMSTILEPLERRFKALSNDQGGIYHERLRHFDRKYLEQAVEYHVDNSKYFPTPGEIKKAYWEARNNDPNRKEKSTEVKGCAHCRYGWVNFTMWGNTEHTSMRLYQKSQPCAYCHPQHNIPMVIKRDNQIYWACRRVRDKVYVQDMNNLEFIEGSQPGRIEDRVES